MVIRSSSSVKENFPGPTTSVMRGSTDGTWTTATIVSRRATFSFSRCIRIARLRLRFRNIGKG